MLSHGLIASLSRTQFTHQSSNSTACSTSHTASWLVLQRCLLTTSDFHQSRLQTSWNSDRPARPPKWCSNYSHVYTRVAAVYLALVLSWTLADCERLRQLPLSFVTNAVFYDVIITAHRRRSVHRLLVTNLFQLDQLTWQTSKHLTRWLRVDTVGAWGWDVHNFCVWIIRNCCPNYWKRKRNNSNSISAKKSRLNY